jgi:hypothetical protein
MYHTLLTLTLKFISLGPIGVRRDRDRLVVGFMTTYAISAYHH